jgi:glycosyltransferase involved in cell wall biosynthesis
MVSEHASPLAELGGEDAGGQNVFVAELAAALAQRGHRVTVHTRRDGRRLPPRVRTAAGVEVHHVDAGPPQPIPKDRLLPHMDEFARVLQRSWRRQRPDVVHAHFWMSGRASLGAAEPLAIPVAQTFHALGTVKRRHQAEHDTSPPERIPEESRIVARVDRVLATCSDELFELVRIGADPRRVSIVPCGVDLDRFRPDGPRFERRRRHLVVTVGRLVPRKGIGNVVSALAHLPDCELLVAGGPCADRLDGDPEVARFRQLAASAGVQDRVRFLGGRSPDDVAALLRSADVVACVPWYEPFGMVALEAMASGVPVVASAVGGLVDTVVDGVTGLHVPPRRAEEVARAIGDLLGRPRLRAAMGAAGAERARRRYGWATVAAETLAVYACMAGDGLPATESQR